MFGVHGIGYLIQFVLGLYLLFSGEALVNLCIPSNRPYCPECGYELSESSQERCPECGVNLTHLFAEQMKLMRIKGSEASDDAGDQRDADQPEHGGDKPLQ